MATSTTEDPADKAICKGGVSMFQGGGSIFFPLVEIESVPLQIVLYLVGLLWMFLGVGIIADVFMGAIEKITSAQRQRINKADPDHKLVWTKLWNSTVANLTLMALGSSAPEILLSIIELIPSNFHAGDLGPSTIVGSAAFNLLCILAVCVVALPDGDTRRIKEIWVFAITAFFSVFAYVWLVVILKFVSPNVIELWEAVVTFMYFPVLVYLSYLADIGRLQKILTRGHSGKKLVLNEHSTPEEIAAMKKIIWDTYGQSSNEHTEQLMKYEFAPVQSRAVQRAAAMRQIAGGKRVKAAVDDDFHEKRTQLRGNKEKEFSDISAVEEAVIQFTTTHWVVIEAQGAKVKLNVSRSGPTGPCSVRYKTRDGTASDASDYVAADAVLEFAESEMRKCIEISVNEDNEHEPTEEFYVDLLEAKGCKVGEIRTATIVVIDANGPGTLGFEKRDIRVQEATGDTTTDVIVKRTGGCTGKVSCSYHTEDETAVGGADYETAEGVLDFDEGQGQAHIQLTIKPKGRYEKTEVFRLVIDQPTGGADLDEEGDGGKDKNILTIQIEADPAGKKEVDRLRAALCMNKDIAKIGYSNWKDQFKEALYVGGDKDAQKEAGAKEWILHLLSIPFKLLFAIVPPADYCGGWLCFFCALCMIGLCTAVIADLANLLGCAMSFKAELCAITFVALGTSLPDTFASKTAAIQDPTADNSIGNVTGSNSVNVFLGLGMPWTVAAIVWRIRDVDINDPNDPTGWYERYHVHETNVVNDPLCATGCYVMPAGQLAMNVIFFVGTALVCIGTLMIRRKVIGAELGGPKKTAWATSILFVSLWLAYVGFNMQDGLYADW